MNKVFLCLMNLISTLIKPKVPIDILIQNLTRKTMHYKLKKKIRKNIFSVVRMLKFKIFNNYFGVI